MPPGMGRQKCHFCEKNEKVSEHVTLFWKLSRNPDKISSKIRRKNLQNLTQKMKKIGNSIFNREKMLTIFG